MDFAKLLCSVEYEKRYFFRSSHFFTVFIHAYSATAWLLHLYDSSFQYKSRFIVKRIELLFPLEDEIYCGGESFKQKRICSFSWMQRIKEHMIRNIRAQSRSSIAENRYFQNSSSTTTSVSLIKTCVNN